MEPKWSKNRCKDRSLFCCLLGSIFEHFLIEFWSENEAKLAPKWNQQSMLTQKAIFSKIVLSLQRGFDFSDFRGGNWEQKSSKIDQKMKSKIRCMLASMFERFRLFFNAKLGWKIHQKLLPKGVQQKDTKKKRLGWASELQKIASWGVLAPAPTRPRKFEKIIIFISFWFLDFQISGLFGISCWGHHLHTCAGDPQSQQNKYAWGP